eukprot:GEMP01020636.1.p1 GENE.GEMP01020636.1~~GEMP01020636.1.p1  ORF type:complete len:580 (+),score=111.94 GEMP01020636.1:93-1832(+)
MQPVQLYVKQLFSQAIRKAFPSIPKQEAIIAAANPKFGDYQCNNAMPLFREYGTTCGFTSPFSMAEEIGKNMPENDIFESVTVLRAGFINIKIRKSWLTARVGEMISNGISYEDRPAKRIAVDFSSPNIAKEMHVGHLRSTIIGESTCRILEFCGHDVHRINHVGDWGTQFGMLIEYMREAYPDFHKNQPDISDLQTFYKAAKKRFDDDADFKKRAQLSVVALQGGDASAREAWKLICEISRVAFDKIYKRLDITVEERGESFYNDMIPPIVKELEERDMITVCDRAKCIWTPTVQNDFPLMMVKSDGGYGYDSTDMAAAYHRLIMERHDWVIYVTDLGQETHFFMIFDAARQAGWHRAPITRLDHMGFGVVLGDDGKKFKTRSGTVVKLESLLDEACERALDELKKRRETQEEKASDEELQKASEAIGYAAVKYFDLKQNRVNNYTFSYDKMLDARGNTAVYLFYTYARVCSILQKLGKPSTSDFDVSKLDISDPAERELALCLLKFPEVLEQILTHLHVHYLADYAYEVTNKFTDFYVKCKVVGSEEVESRLVLCEATRRLLHQCFYLLGFTALEKI